MGRRSRKSCCGSPTRKSSASARATRASQARANVDVPDTKATATFFRVYKLVLKFRFKQEDIYMTSRPVAHVRTFQFA